MTEYNLKYQQIVHVNIDDVSYELNFVGNVVSFMQNDSRCVKHALISAAEGFNNVAVNVSAYVKSDVTYFPIVVLDEGIASHISSYCTYTDGWVTLYYDGTEFESYNNTITLIPVVEEDNPINGITNGKRDLTPIILDQVWLENTSDEPVSHILIDLTNDYGVTYDANKSYVPIMNINTDEFAQYISYVRVTKLSSKYQLEIHTPHNVYIPAGLNSNSSVILVPVNSVAGQIYYYGAVNNGNKVYQTKTNLVTSVSSSSTDAEYPSAKCVYDALQNAGGGVIFIHNIAPTYVGTNEGDISVSSYVDANKDYLPIVTTAHEPNIFAGRSGLTDCSYTKSTGNVVLRYDDNTYQRNNNVVYDVVLIPISDVETASPFYSYKGICDGFSSLQTTNNLVTSISSSSTDTQYPSAKCVYDALADKQDTLVSGTNIKTINGNSLLGNGDITISSLPSQTGNTGKFLTTDGTEASWGGALANTATGQYSLTILGSATSSQASMNIGDGSLVSGNFATAIGCNSQAGSESTAVGMYARSSGGSSVAVGRSASASKSSGVAVGKSSSSQGFFSVALGGAASANADYCVQIGPAANNESNTMKVSFGGTNYTLIDSTGQIPSSMLTSTLGNIETLLQSI